MNLGEGHKGQRTKDDKDQKDSKDLSIVFSPCCP